MNTMKSVFSKIAEDKTELAKHEVELASVADLKKALGAVKKGGMDNYRKARSNFDESRRNLQNAVNDLENRNEVLEKAINEFNKSVKDLGLNPNSVKEYGEAESMLQDSKAIVKNTKF